MRKLILFLSGLILLAVMFGVITVSGLIYDTSAKTTVETYFFQPADNNLRRPGVPVSPSDLGDEAMRQRLISKYITEYFYVTPDTTDLERRKSGQTALARMSTRAAFDTWLATAVPEIEELSTQGALRTVSLISATQRPNEKYWEIVYELKTWSKSNNFSVLPTTDRGILYLDIFYQPGMRAMVGKKTIEQYLESGGDPAVVFRFGVLDVASQN